MRALPLVLLLAACATTDYPKSPTGIYHRAPPIKEVAAATSDAAENAKTRELAYQGASGKLQLAVQAGKADDRLDAVAALDDRAEGALEELRRWKPGTPEYTAALHYFNYALADLLAATENSDGPAEHHH